MSQQENIRQHLIDYLFDELDADEHRRVEARLAQDANLRRELKVLEARFDVLRDRRTESDPPAGLASRTLAAIDAYDEERKVTPVGRRVVLSASGSAFRKSTFKLADLVVAAGICMAAAMLFFPAIANSRFHSQVTVCQNNLREVGLALQNYNTRHHEIFPPVATMGKMAFAGSYTIALRDTQMLDNPQVFLCPSAPQVDRERCWQIPTRDEIEAAQGQHLVWLRERTGGSYGYTLGYVVDNEYHPTVNRGRTTFAIMADAPRSQLTNASGANHMGKGQNVLYEDFHVQYVTKCADERCGDAYFENRWGLQAAGVDAHDAVVGSSGSSPVIFSGQ